MTEQLVLDGRYRLEEWSAKGGFGVLWKARDLYTDSWVAVKVLHDAAELLRMHETSDVAALERELIARFRRECDILREIRHPAIPAWLNQGFHGHRPYLVMEWVDGVPLRDFIKSYGALKPSVVASIVVQVAEALACAHRHGFIHRDLNPSNVMITAQGTVHLIDFGIALPLDPGATRYTAYGHRSPGTPGYTSPEQIRGGTIGPASDAYSFGCVAFELHTGRWPFHANSEGGLEYQHESGRSAPPIADHAPGLPAELAETVDRMLVKQVGARLADVADVLDAYRPFLPVEGDPEPLPRMTHDPTLPFRKPRRSQPAQPARVPRPRRSRAAHRNTPQLHPAEAEIVLGAARKELLEGQGPGPHCKALQQMRQEAVRAWGIRTKLTARIQLTCADAEFSGAENQSGTESASELYRELVAELSEHADPSMREVFLSARVGAASCMWALETDPAAAFDGWAAVLLETVTLVEPPVDTVRRCRELGKDFIEAQVRVVQAQALLDRLPGIET